MRQNFGNVPLEPVTRTCHGSALHLRDFFIIHANIDYFRSSRFFVRRKLIISREYEQILHIIPRRYCLVKVPVPLFQYVFVSPFMTSPYEYVPTVTKVERYHNSAVV